MAGRVAMAAWVLAALGGAAPAAAFCAGDCNGDALVRVEELVRGVALALGVPGAEPCPMLDADADGGVSASDLVAAVNFALGPGCRRERRFVRDAEDRALILHGVNVSNDAKRDPLRNPWVGPADVQRLAAEWGFNFVRYLIFWDALEPSPGTFDEAYLERVEERLDWMAAAGLLVVLDMHQDVYSQVFCCDGAPAWAVRDDGLPFQRQSPWFLNYFQPAVMRAFDNFFDAGGPHADLQEHYAAAWVRVAQRLGDHPAVLGYDLMNEPFPGSAFSFDEVLRIEDPAGSTARFDRERLQPFYERLIAALRGVDRENWIFFEPRAGPPAAGMASYLGRMDDPRPGGDRLAYVPHLYSTQLEAAGVYDPATDPTIADWARNRRREAAELRAPLLIGEFGVSQSVRGGPEHVADVVEMADAETSGWAVWSYDRGGGFSLLDAEGNEQLQLEPLVRAYPARVPGQPLDYGFEAGRRRLFLAFETAPSDTAPAEIRIPARRLYPEGWRLWVSDPEGTWAAAWNPAAQTLELRVDPALGHHAVVVWPDG